MKLNLADGIDIDAQRVVTGRGCAIGQSGSGKSYLAGVMAEELCRARMPFCVIDTEGEYGSLKKMFNLILVGGENGDVGLDVDFSRLFEASITNSVPVVLDLSDSLDKMSVVNSALHALYSIEDKVRKPYLVIVEEADVFAPQVLASQGNIIEEIGVRGRKRGIGLFITTQRPAKVSKNVLAQCSYGFIGKLTIENDLNAIRILFENREKLVLVTKLAVGEFVPFGVDAVGKFKVKGRLAQPGGATPAIDESGKKGDRVVTIIKELKNDKISFSEKKPARSSLQTIEALQLKLDIRSATKYAERMLKRRFVFFGDAVEKIDSVELRYLPFELCNIRIPTSRKNEYLEYQCLFNQRHELVQIDRQIRYLTWESVGKRSKNNYEDCLIRNPISTETIKVEKGITMQRSISSKRIGVSVLKFFHSAILTESHTIYLPVYSITLRIENKIRVFTIDGIYGKAVDL